MGCPYSEGELENWEGVDNPMGKACSACLEYDCGHNANENSEVVQLDEEYAALFRGG